MSALPKSLERLDLKASTISILNEILAQIEASDTSTSRLIFFTNFAMIEGSYFELNGESEQQEKTFFEALLTKTIEFRKNDITEIEKDYENLRVINDSAFITLTDVVITPYTLPESGHKISEMVLFTDHIVGLSFGELRVRQSDL